MSRRVSKQDMKSTELQRAILSMAGRYTAYEIFMDWIESLALALANTIRWKHDSLWEKREATYKSIMDRYTSEERIKFCELTAWLIEELEDQPRDVLGEVFMRSGMGADAGGQFFTPFNISEMMAAISVEPPEEGEKITFNEPTCGSGGGIIAAAISLKAKGVNYQNCMKVVCQDLDWRCVYMCYVQLSFMGIDAICVQGNTLLDPYRKGSIPENRILRTPKNAGALL